MCFRPPTIDIAEIECPECGAAIPMESETCPECGAVIALNSAAPPPPGLMAPAPMVRPRPPKAPGAPKAPGSPKVPPAPARAPVATPAPAEEPACEEIRVPVIGGRIRIPAGMELFGESHVPDAPTGPGLGEAPDISNTGNYFTSGVFNNA